jgi:hypothetical protein
MRAASLFAVLALAGCAAPPAQSPPPGAVLQAGKDYRSYSQVYTGPKVAPTLCASPMPQPNRSTSRDADTHGMKLYYLFAKDYAAYRRAKHGAQPVGQVIVKEAWFPRAGADPKSRDTGEKGPLFIMVKTGEPDSDEGWIYATTAPDGKSVTSWGRLASCMECHRDAKHDRLFGPQS